ncbi:hypothetical protein AJ79_08315 [Helicocarpus griseus UAMH5409]|uniref:Uncharacterized protein n=1 Tax=Helicocarpus griseus UAMH5409 TaxID=1447875 RepID=A0A2B7WKZ6_9EURO|nr:hypothetical protein AJ79_08315 [Helicocarpus griseus UAMH5409]
MAPFSTLIISDTPARRSERATPPLSADYISKYFSDLLRSSTAAIVSQTLSVKSFPAMTESVDTTYTTTTTTIYKTIPFIEPSSSSASPSFTTSTVTPAKPSPPSSAPSIPKSSHSELATTSDHPKVTESAAAGGGCSEQKGTPKVVLILLIITAVTAVALSVAICWVKKNRKLCKQCKAPLLDQTLTKRRPSTHDTGTQQVSQPESPRGASERIRGMAASVLSFNTQLSRFQNTPHRNAEQGDSQWAPGSRNITSSSVPHGRDSEVTSVAPRLPPMNWEATRAEPASGYSNTFINSEGPQRGHGSTSIVSIIEKYAQMPDETADRLSHHNNTSQRVGQDESTPVNPTLGRHASNPSADVLTGSLRSHRRNNRQIVGADPVSSDPAWKSTNDEREGTIASTSTASTGPYHRFRVEQQRRLAMKKLNRSDYATRTGSPLAPQQEGFTTRTPREERELSQNESDSTPMESSRASPPTSITSMSTQRPAKYVQNDELPPPGFRGGPSRSSHAPSDTTMDSDANLTRMLRQWAFIDKQNMGLEDRAPTRSSSVRENRKDNEDAKLVPQGLNVRRSTSTPLPRLLSKFPFSGDKRASKDNGVELQVMKGSQSERTIRGHAPTTNQDDDWPSAHGYGSVSRSRTYDHNGRDDGSDEAHSNERAYSASSYSRPTTLLRVPEDYQTGEGNYNTNGSRLYAQQMYGSSEAGPSKQTAVTSFLDDWGDDNDTPADYVRNKYLRPESGSGSHTRKRSLLSLGRRGMVHDNRLGGTRTAGATEKDVLIGPNIYDAEGYGDSRRGSFIRGMAEIYGGVRKKRKGKKPIVGDGSFKKRRSGFLDVKKYFQ